MSRRHQHARRADAALRAATMQKRLLQRMQFTVTSQAFNGFNLRALGLKHRNKAAVHQLAVHANRTGPAFAFATAFLRAGEMQVFAQDVEEPLHRRRMHLSLFSVDDHFNSGPMDAHTAAASSTGVRFASFSNKSSGNRGIELNEMPMASRIALRIAGAGPS